MKMMQDDKGNTSSMRAGMFIAVVSGCAVSIMGVYLDRDLFGISTLAIGLVSAGLGFKALQKGKEQE